MTLPASWAPFFAWCQSTLVGTTIHESAWMFPVLEGLHLIALCLLGGALLVVDLRLLGFGLTGQEVGVLARRARPWLVGGIAAMIGTGALLFLSEAVKCSRIPAFWALIVMFPIALLFTFGVREPLARRARGGLAGEPATDRGVAPRHARLVAITSLALWLTVAAAGRWIGFS